MQTLTEEPPVTEFPKPSLTADIVLLTVLDQRLKVLLVMRGKEPFKGRWALPGGFSEPSETITSTARRELREETGVENINPHHFGIYSDPKRDPRGWIVSAGFVTFINPEAVAKNPPKAGDDAREVQWANVDELPELAFDHKQILEEALAHVRLLAMNTALLRPLFPKKCNVSDIEAAFKVVLGTKRWENQGWTGEVIAIELEQNELLDRHYDEATPEDDVCIWKE